MNLILDVVTPLGAKLSREEATSLTLPGVIGEMGILAGHTPLMAALKIGRMTVQRGKKEKVFAISGGYVEVADDRVIVLTETCEESTEIDAERAAKAKTSALEELKKLTPADGEAYSAALLRLQRAETRLDVSRIRN